MMRDSCEPLNRTKAETIFRAACVRVVATLRSWQCFLPRKFLAQRRKGAKRCRVFCGFLCVFAPLREKYPRQKTLFVQSRQQIYFCLPVDHSSWLVYQLPIRNVAATSTQAARKTSSAFVQFSGSQESPIISARTL